MLQNPKLQKAFAAFDAYNMADPEMELADGKSFPKALLYGHRMSQWLDKYEPAASEAVQLAARCQHVGRWEIGRSTYSMDKKGYLQWRSAEKVHQGNIAERILRSEGYDDSAIEQVKFLLLKKELQTNPETKLLEDIVCLVFIQYYLEDFASKHSEEKVVDILKKTMKKMTPRAINEVDKINPGSKIKSLIAKAI